MVWLRYVLCNLRILHRHTYINEQKENVTKTDPWFYRSNNLIHRPHKCICCNYTTNQLSIAVKNIIINLFAKTTRIWKILASASLLYKKKKLNLNENFTQIYTRTDYNTIFFYSIAKFTYYIEVYTKSQSFTNYNTLHLYFDRSVGCLA